MMTLTELTSKFWEKKEKPIKGNTYNTRVLVRVDGKDYDISNVTINNDGVLGEYFVIHTTQIEI